MHSPFLSAAVLLACTFAFPAQGPVNDVGVPFNLPQGEADLYPPFRYEPGVYFPSQVGIPFRDFNSSKQPWNTQPGPARPAVDIAHASCTLTATNPGASKYWYEHIKHNGESPFINDPSSYTVFRNVVTKYGADNTGKTDASAAIQNAINAGSSSSSRISGSLGTTGQPAVVYLPAGTYLINSPLQLTVGTVLMGNPLSRPTIKAVSGFSGSFVIYGKDPNYDSTINFYIAVKHIILDSTAVNPSQTLTLLDWSVSQATQLTDLVFNMPDYSTGHTGLSTPEGGSGTMMGDLVFNGGAVGMNIDNQQYEAKSITFNGCTTGILITHCFDCVFTNCNFMNGGTGIDMTTTSNTVGSIILLDSTASNVGNVVLTNSESTGAHTLVVENFSKGSGVGNIVTASGNSVLNASVSGAWVYGNVYTSGGPATGSHQTGNTYAVTRSGSLLTNGKYATVPPPTFSQYGVKQIVNVKSVSGYPVAGDGVTDDTSNLNAIISMYAGCKVLYFPQGTYIVTNTLFFPSGSRVVGEAWSTISGTGSNFYNPSDPTVMVRVGTAGSTTPGVAQFVDMLFTVADVLQGCTLLEVNLAGSSPGDVGFWNTHFRVGGAKGSKVETDCSGSPASCKAAFLLAHLTSTSSAYIENMWGWTADHDLDGTNGQTISTGRGMLVEATSATWLHGTAFEHNTLYQYNMNNAANVFAGMQQSETPYWQGTGAASFAPAPWTPLSSYGDPSFSACASGDGQCRMAWFELVSGCKNMFLYGSGFWTFFNDSSGTCQNSNVCQTNAIDVLGGTTGLYWFGINTHTNLNVLVSGGTLVTQNNNPGSWGACVGAFLTDD